MVSNSALEISRLREQLKQANRRSEQLQDKINLLRAAWREGTDSRTFFSEAGVILGLAEEAQEYTLQTSRKF